MKKTNIRSNSFSEKAGVGIRQNALYVPTSEIVEKSKNSQAYTYDFVANLANLGFGVAEPLLQRLFTTSEDFQRNIYAHLAEVTGINKNWTPLVKGWDTPTGETFGDHFMTLLTNIFGGSGTKMPCGHVIPKGTFPLERYNGCPFCGTPFEFGALNLEKQGSNQKVLELWGNAELDHFFKSLLVSKTALDATQMDSLKILLSKMPLPNVEIAMKETLIAVIDSLVEKGEGDKAQRFFQTPTDILRYLWYKHTGFLQIVEPQTIVKRTTKNNRAFLQANNTTAVSEKIATLKLKYSRKEAFIFASWLNKLPLSAEKMCEMMHPKRGIWVRMIRALRLAEFSKRKGFEPLANLMDVFYNQKYSVWEGQVSTYKLRLDEAKTLELLSQRPGLFARSLFATMLWFDYKNVVNAFSKIADKVPARLIFTLNSYAQNYFDPTGGRSIKGLGGVSKYIPNNPLLKNYKAEELDDMKARLEELCLETVMNRFANIENPNKSIYIDPDLYKMPVSIGDRSENVQDLPSALMGTKFPVEGNAVRLFLQWGVGLSAQHLDMDLSCHLAFKNGNTSICSYSNLVTTGCKHSGDIRHIPEKIGTAEYIEINIPELQKADVQYVTFTCNAYSMGALSPNLVVGWMNSAYKMTISETTGVAYDPSCVQHQVRITQNLTKGLVFGVLDVEAREIIWFELPFYGQVIQQLDTRGVTALIGKLNAKLSVGNLLKIKALSQNLTITETPDADEIYTNEWARNTAEVTQLLID
jgi:hypothetical protein